MLRGQRELNAENCETDAKDLCSERISFGEETARFPPHWPGKVAQIQNPGKLDYLEGQCTHVQDSLETGNAGSQMWNYPCCTTHCSGNACSPSQKRPV